MDILLYLIIAMGILVIIIIMALWLKTLKENKELKIKAKRSTK